MRNAFIKAIAHGNAEPIKACMNAVSTPTTSMESWLTYSRDQIQSSLGRLTPHLTAASCLG